MLEVIYELKNSRSDFLRCYQATKVSFSSNISGMLFFYEWYFSALKSNSNTAILD